MRCRGVDGKPAYECLRVMCKSYGCSVCGPRKAVRLRKAIAAKALELSLTRFLTLTLDPKKIPPGADPVKYIRGEVWAKFRTYLKREYGKAVVYIAVLEFQGRCPAPARPGRPLHLPGLDLADMG